MRESISITLDKPRNLRLTLSAMAAFEKQTGKSFLKGFKFGELTLQDWQILLHLCLVHEDKGLTLDAVGAMVDSDNFSDVRDAIIKASQTSGDKSPNVESLPNG
jgi:hypothetical protein